MKKCLIALLLALAICLTAAAALAADVPTMELNNLYANGTAVVIDAPDTDRGNRTCIVQTTGVYFSNTKIDGGALIYWGDSDTGGYVYASKNVAVSGGGNDSALTGNTKIDMRGGALGHIYGGGYGATATVSGSTEVAVSGGEIAHNIAGGGYMGAVGTAGGGSTTTVTISQADANKPTSIGGGVYGGGIHGAVVGDTKVFVTGGTVQQSVYGSGMAITATVSGNTEVSVTGGVIKLQVFGGGRNSAVGTPQGGGNTTVRISQTDANTPTSIGSVYGGSRSDDGIIYGDTKVFVTGGTVNGSVYGNGSSDVKGNAYVSVTGGTVTNNVYGGGNGDNSKVRVNSAVTISEDDGTVTIGGNVYGGGDSGAVGGNASVSVTGGTVSGNVYGGGNQKSSVGGNATVSLDGGTVSGNVYGGGNQKSSVGGDAAVSITGGIVIGSVYGGGGDSSSVGGNAAVSVTAGAVHESVYGGSVSTATVAGDKTVSVQGKPLIGNKKQYGIYLTSITSQAVSISGPLTGADGDITLLLGNTAGGTVVATAADPANAIAEKFTASDSGVTAGISLMRMGNNVVISVPPPKPRTPPKTGDESAPFVWLALCLLCGAALVALLVWRRKRRGG